MTTESPNVTPDIGRNEPCPCGSGKKYKRCHGVSAAPKLGAPRAMPDFGAGGAGGAPAGFDPSQMDPAAMAQVAQMLQRLPKGQMAKLQSIMQQAMAGKDVSREAEAFERTLPVDFQDMLKGMKLPGMEAMGGGAAPAELEAPPEAMTADQARRLVEEAAKSGQISQEEAAALLAQSANVNFEADADEASTDLTTDVIEATDKPATEKKGISKLFGWGKKG